MPYPITRTLRLFVAELLPNIWAGPLFTSSWFRPGFFYHSFGEGKECAAPAAREPPRSAVGAGLVPVPLAPHKEDDLPAPAARERQAPRYLYLAYAHRPPLIFFLRFRYPPRA